MVGLNAQESEDNASLGRLYGGLESNMQYYLDDNELSFEQPDEAFRSNSYLYLNYNIGRFTAGFQVESYEENALLNYNPLFNGTDLGTYYINYKSEKLDVTIGHFYEQFETV